MHRVRSYRRRDGVRVRSHYRRRRGHGGGRRSTLRHVRADAAGAWGGGRAGWVLLAALPTLCLVVAIARFVERHPVWSGLIAASLVAVAVVVLRSWLGARARQRLRQEEMDRSVATTDTMTGEQFEHWVAALLRRSGLTQVQVCGRAGDRGADIVGYTQDGRRVVVQCKRHDWGNPVRSAAIQQFAGTCRTVHQGQLCMIVTNGRFTTGDGIQLARELDITLVDRTALATWAAYGTAPAGIAHRLTPAV